MAIAAHAARMGGDGAVLQMGDVLSSLSVTSLTTTFVTVETNFTTLAQVNNVNPVQECAEVDVTSLQSGINREYRPGHLSATLSANLNFVQDLGTSKDGLDLLNTIQGREIRAWRLRIPVDPGTVTAATATQFNMGFLGFLTNLSPTCTDDDEPMTADASFRVIDSQFVDVIG